MTRTKFSSSNKSASWALPDKLLPMRLFKHIQHCRHQTGDYFVPGDETDLNNLTSDKLFAAIPNLAPTDFFFKPISVEKLVIFHLSYALWIDIRRHLNDGVVLLFSKYNKGLICREVSHDQSVGFHALKQRVLLIHHYSRLAVHSSRHKL